MRAERPSADKNVVVSNLLNSSSEGLYSEEIVAVKRSKDQPQPISDVQGLSGESVMNGSESTSTSVADDFTLNSSVSVQCFV